MVTDKVLCQFTSFIEGIRNHQPNLCLVSVRKAPNEPRARVSWIGKQSSRLFLLRGLFNRPAIGFGAGGFEVILDFGDDVGVSGGDVLFLGDVGFEVV